jgi:molecular chaperone IbpA
MGRNKTTCLKRSLEMVYDPLHNAFKAYNANSVGFDSLFNQLTNFSEHLPKIPTYPPYNIKKTDENTYVIEIAVAGFGKQDIELTLENGTLTIKGNITSDDVNEYIFKGIADRAFTRSFTLADTVEVKNADLINGMLKIWLERFIPESAKPKKIEINETGVAVDKTIADARKKKEAA